MENLSIVSDYIYNDKDEKRVRINIHSKEINYVNELNELIKSSFDLGVGSKIVEDGVIYLVVYTKADKSVLNNYMQVLMAKGNFDIMGSIFPDIKEWSVYYPFTLSIIEPQSIFDFVSGEMTIFVLIESRNLIKQFAEEGYNVKVDCVNKTIIFLGSTIPGIKPAIKKVNNIFFNRIFYEFISPYWLVNEVLSRERYVQSQIQSDK